MTAEPAGTLSEVVVTAEKRSQRLIDVPQAVSVISAKQLEQAAAVQLRDLAATVPGLTLSTAGAGANQISLRGVTTGGIDVSSTVATYVDEVPYGSSTTFGRNSHYGSDGALFNVSRIEVLRGPQGTLYGASAMGGLLKYVTIEPSVSGFGGDIRGGISGTSHGGTSYTGALAVNLPFSDKAALRVSAYDTHDGGFIDNPVNKAKDVNRADLRGVRADLLLLPIDKLSVRLVAEEQYIRRDGTSTVDYTSGLAGVPVVGSLSQARPIAEPFRQTFKLLAGTVNYDFGPVTLTSISSYQITDTNTVNDSSANFVPLLARVGLVYGGFGISDDPRNKKFTEEVRLASSVHDRVDWIVGAFYTKEDGARTSQAVLETPTGAAAANFAFGEPLAFLDAPSKYEEKAVFGDLTVHLTDRLEATGGIRYSTIDQTYNQTIHGLLFEPFTGFFPASSSEHVTTYLANIRYAVTDHSSAYFRYATGYRPGGPNFVVLATTPRDFSADRLQSYELGYKAETLDHNYALDAAIYHINWDNIQTFDLTSPIGGFRNAPGGAEINGAEVSVAARPLERLTLNGSLTYQDATLRQADASLFAAKGDSLPNVPKWSGALAADYQIADNDWKPSVGATWRFVSRRESSFTLSPTRHQLPAYTMLDLRAQITVVGIDAQVYVHNLTDERAQLSGVAAGGRPTIAIAQPRTVGLALHKRF